MEELEKLNSEDQCMVHRYLYYVLDNPIITDHEYDALEAGAVMYAPHEHPIYDPGSDLDSSYSEEIKRIAKLLI